MAKLLLPISIIFYSYAFAENPAFLETEDSQINFVSLTDNGKDSKILIFPLIETSILSSTTPMPEPPVVERIEIRLIDGENTTQETPLIIVNFEILI